MIKTGIYNLQDIKTKDTTFICQNLKNVTITLYDKILQEPNADELAERILLLFSDERGAYKRTYGKRFEEFDPIALRQLENTFKKEEPLRIQDVGVSNGSTALDFFEKTSEIFSNLKFTASDYNPKVYILEQGKCKVTLSHTGNVLEILFPPFVFNTIKRDRYLVYPLNHLIRFIIELLIVKPLVKRFKVGEIQAKELMLFAPKVLNVAKEDTRFILSQHDLLQPFKEQSHVIRAMNILNPSYFSEVEFTTVLSHIHIGLCKEGFLITGSNQEAGTIVNGGLYKKTSKGFQKIIQSGNGSPIEKMILEMNI